MASEDLFSFLNDVWQLLPEKDRARFGETWTAYEQTYGDVWMKMFEQELATKIDTLPLYNVQRWLKHTFDSTTEINRPAKFRTNQDISGGLNLSIKYLIKFAVDGGTPVEVDLRGAIASDTKNYEIVSAINTAAGFEFAKLVVLNALMDLQSSTTGPLSTIEFFPVSNPAADATEIVIGIDSLSLPVLMPEFPHEFLLGDQYIVGIPTLQDKIHDEMVDVKLIEDVDYQIEFGSGIISFKLMPPEKMWAKNSLVNQETPYNNYGYLMDIYDKNTPGYLKAVKGLWFAFWSGPRPENIRKALYLLFGLPTASKAGVVEATTLTTISLKYNDGTTETFDIPSGLTSLVISGQAVSSFQPLVDGITVLDKINKPGFIESEIGRAGVAAFLTEKATRGTNPDTDESRALKTVEENAYLPQIDVNAFISPDIKLGNVQTFLKNIQPKSRTFLFQVLVGVFRELLELKERLAMDISFDVTPNVDYNPNTEVSQDDLDDAEVNDNTGIILDSEVISIRDTVDVEVRHFGSLVDSFTIEG